MNEIRKTFLFPNRKVEKNTYKIDKDKYELYQFLDLFGLSRNLGVLPFSGGLLDQDSYFVFLMRHALACQAEKQEIDERRNSASQHSRPMATPPRHRFGR